MFTNRSAEVVTFLVAVTGRGADGPVEFLQQLGAATRSEDCLFELPHGACMLSLQFEALPRIDGCRVRTEFIGLRDMDHPSSSATLMRADAILVLCDSADGEPSTGVPPGSEQDEKMILLRPGDLPVAVCKSVLSWLYSQHDEGTLTEHNSSPSA